MSLPSYVQRAFPAIIKATGNPVTPIVLQEAYTAVERLGRVLSKAPDANQQRVTDFQTLMLEWMKDAETEGQSTEVNFCLAACSICAQAIVSYTSHLVPPPTK